MQESRIRKKNTVHNYRVKKRLNTILCDKVPESDILPRHFEEHPFKEFPILLLHKEYPILRVYSFHFYYAFLFIQ